MKRNTLRFHYGNGWLMAALVVFLLLCFMALVRGQVMPPEPPVFAREKVTTQPEPDYMLKSPKDTGRIKDGAMVTQFWDYGEDVLKPVLQSPKSFSMIDGVAMAIPQPPAVPLNILETCHFTVEYAGEWDGKHYYTFQIDWSGTLEVSFDLVHWTVVQDKSEGVIYSTNIVGYFIAETSEKTMFFRAVP